MRVVSYFALTLPQPAESPHEGKYIGVAVDVPDVNGLDRCGKDRMNSPISATSRSSRRT